MADRLCWAPHFFESGSAFWPCVLVPDSEVPPNLHQDVRQPDARLVRFLGGGPGKPIYNWCNEQDLLMWAQNFQLLQVARGVPQQLLPMFSLGMQETIPMRQPQQHMSQTALQHLASLARGQQHGRICKVCSRASGASGVQCGACTSWVHSGCDEFAAAVAAASPEDDVEYFCPTCRAALLQQHPSQHPSQKQHPSHHASKTSIPVNTAG
eukprot:gene23862-9425_t